LLPPTPMKRMSVARSVTGPSLVIGCGQRGPFKFPITEVSNLRDDHAPIMSGVCVCHPFQNDFTRDKWIVAPIQVMRDFIS
jgi:predicted small lipoprotein YifL